MKPSTWYAVLRNRDDNWTVGSYNLEEAKRIAAEKQKDYPDTLIAVIEKGKITAEITDF